MTRRICYIVLAAFMAVVVACESDYSFHGNTTSISFSADTLCFDTVFTGEAAFTSKLMVYNRSGENMTIDNIELAGGKESAYNVNINGQNTTSVRGLRLRSGDSLFVFVNIYPKASENAIYAVEDDIVVKSGANSWRAHLLAYGMNVRRISGHISSNTRFDSEIPYLISDTLTIDRDATLTIDKGTTLYMAEKSHIEVSGRLIANGTLDEKITIKAARTEKFYNDIPGQWDGIRLTAGLGQAEINNSEIANATFAVEADSATSAKLYNVIVRDALKNGVIGHCSEVGLYNCIMYDCGGALIAADGGDVEAIHCTLSNYFRWQVRLEPSILVSSSDNRPLERVLIANTVAVGSSTNELELSEETAKENCLISHCYLRLGTQWKENEDERMDAVVVGKDAGFVGIENFNFRLSEESALIRAGSVEYARKVPVDFNGKIRNTECTDIGAIEHIDMK